MIQAIGLTSARRRELPPAVDDLTFEAPPGKITVLLGAEGAGKTTALRLMLQLQRGRGVALFRGRPLHRVPNPAREVGVVLGDVPGHPSRTARGHLRMLSAAAGVPAGRADDVLDVVGLSGLAYQRLGEFSRGMDRRLALAVALLGDPQTLVLDDPSAGVSPREVAWLHGLLRGYAAQGAAVLVTSRDAREAARLADRVVTIEEGRLVADQDATDFARTRLRPRVVVRSPHADRLAAVLMDESQRARHATDPAVGRAIEVVRESGSRIAVYGSTCATVGDTAFRHGILVHRLAEEVGHTGPVTPLDRADGRLASPSNRADEAKEAGGVGEVSEVTVTAAPHVSSVAPPMTLHAVVVPGAEPDHVVARRSPEASTDPAGVTRSDAAQPEPDSRSAPGPSRRPAPGQSHRPAPGPSPGSAPGSFPRSAPGTSPRLSSRPTPRMTQPMTPLIARRPGVPAVPATARTAASASSSSASPAPPGTASPRTPRSRSRSALRPANTSASASPSSGSSAAARGVIPRLSAPAPVWPLRYELRRTVSDRAALLVPAVALAASVALALLQTRTADVSFARVITAWPAQLPFPPAALGAGLAGALAFGQEFRYPALAPDRGGVPRRLGLLMAKLLVSGAIALLLAAAVLLVDGLLMRVLFGAQALPRAADGALFAFGWTVLVVGCAWAGLLAAGLFRSTAMGLAVVLAVPMLIVPAVQRLWDVPAARALADVSARLRSAALIQWPPGFDREASVVLRMAAQPVGGALVLALTTLVCAYVLTALSRRIR
ncbi:ATP-binding cassette domain-containing protein [Streptomyces sp. MST-110588]|uniref:ATP-binding cassette domain-containing protein n=1 Tax=Streptomyces sp. MST-110588 TaxID=2833628 RepID=UPI001F5D692B|nr:ATP-binding cassette domain-containing protein [Streptomyces sp. MST-110588]UNO39572.1 ATP-binding cassette domain-containing protein [Streptomyces sp. MST-110588]